MAIFYTDSGSFNSLQVTGSATISASSGIALQVKSSGSTIFSISGSGGEILNISDSSSSNLFSVSSGSVNIFSVDNTKAVRISGSLIVTGSIIGTASYATQALSSSFATTASYILGTVTSASYAVSASLAQTASYSLNSDLLDGRDSTTFANTGSNTFLGNQTVTGSLFTTGSNTLIGNNTILGNNTITGSNNILGNSTLSGSITISGNTLITGSITAINQTASFGYVSASFLDITGKQTVKGFTQYLPTSDIVPISTVGGYIYSSGSQGDLYFAQTNGSTNNVTRLRWIEGNMYSGLLNGGLIGSASSTVYSISSGSGIIVSLNASFTVDPYPTVQFITWGNLTSSIAPLSASYDQSFIAIQPSGSTGIPYAQGTPYADGQYDTLIPLGVVLHQNHSTINNVRSQPNVGYGLSQRSSVFIKAFGPLKLSGFTLAPSGSSTGSLVVGSGTAYSDGANYPVDPNNPSYVIDPGTNISKIWRYYDSGSGWVYDTVGGAGYPTIDPTRYSLNGVLTAVPGTGANKQWTIQRAFWFPNSVAKATVVYYGNQTYATDVEAIANIPFETFTEAPNTAANAIYLGSLIVRNDANFTDSTSYKIQPGGLFRQVGGSGGGGSTITQTLAGLSDVAISGPLNKQSLVYSNVSNKWENTYALSGSLIGNASTATSASYATTASYVVQAISSSLAQTASYVQNAQTASYVLNAQTASYVTTAQTASYVAQAISSSYASTASYLNTLNQNLTFNGNLTLNGTASIAYLNVTYESSSVIYSSGSNQFGDATNDTQTLIGRVIVSGSLEVTGSTNIPSITGSLLGTASYANQALLSTNVVGSTDRILFNNGTNTTTTSNNLTWTDSINLLTLGSATGTAGTISKLALYTSSYGGYGFGVSPAQLDYVTDGSHVFYKNGITPTELVRITSTGDVNIAGTLYATGSITGSLLGTASYALQALSASYAPDTTFPYTGSAQITGSLEVTGSFYNSSIAFISGGLVVGDELDGYVQSGNHKVQIIADGTQTPLMIEGGSGAIEIWKDTTPTSAVAFGMTSPGNAITDDFVFSAYQSSWVETMRIVTPSSSLQHGNSTQALGQYSHAEGQGTQAGGGTSHTEGSNTITFYESSHAEGIASSAGILGYSGNASSGDITLSASYGDVTDQFSIPYIITQGIIIPYSSVSYIGGETHVVLYDTTINGKIDIGVYGVAKPNLADALLGGSAYSHAEGNTSVTLGGSSHAEGFYTLASGESSHAEGNSTSAKGDYSHAEGQFSIASGSYSHAEGESTYANGFTSHTEGLGTTTQGNYSHAEGKSTIAFGIGSHAEGEGTIASGSTQHVSGKYNRHGDDTSLFIIGNGIDDLNRSDVFRVSGSTVQVTGSLNVTGSEVRLVTDLFVVSQEGGADLIYADPYGGITLFDDNAVAGFDLTSGLRKLYDSASADSVDWNNRKLIKSDGSTISIDWENGAFTGSLEGTASYATLANTATTASYYGGTVTTAVTASYSTNFTVSSTLTLDETLTDFAKVNSTIVGSNNLFTQATGSYTSAFGKYTLFKGANSRAGEFIVSKNGTTVTYTDTSTTDIGSTTDISFSAAIVAGSIQINAVAASSGWTVKMLTTFI